MALQLGALYAALKAAGADDETAREAAEEVAAYENQLTALRSDIAALRAYADQQFGRVDQRFTELRAYVDRQFVELRADNAGLRREVRLVGGVLFGLLVPMLVKLFVHG